MFACYREVGTGTPRGYKNMSLTHRREKLVWISTRVPYPPVTGHFLRSFHVMRGLAERYDIYFFGFFDRGTSAAAAAEATAALGSFCVDVYAEYVRSERSRLWLLVDLARSIVAWKPFVAIKYFSPKLASALRSVLDRNAIALVHADSLPSGEYLVGLRHPKLLTNHNVEFVRLRRHADLHRILPMRYFLRWQAYLLRRFEIAMLREVGGCVVVSEADRSVLHDLAPNATYFVVNNGADVSTPPLPAHCGSEPTALWVGGMSDPYNREAVLYFFEDILPLIRRRLPQLRWRVVGSNPPQALVAAAAKADSGVELAGFVETVRDEYERADIVVVPVISGGGTKLKVLEAMAMGRAVVTTPVGAEGILARAGVELEIADSARAFAEHVVELLSDATRRIAMATAARDLIERCYDWRVVNAQMCDAVATTIEQAEFEATPARGPINDT
jgi:polysaccharide biosynthesis protein PslH